MSVVCVSVPPVRLTGRLEAMLTRRDLEAAQRRTQSVAGAGVMPQVASPWAPTSTLNPVVWPDLFGTDVDGPLSRAAAIGLPPVARQRHLICGTVARLPLQQWTGATLEPPPEWATRTDGALPPFHRMLWTCDDLIFGGWSLWWADRNTDKTLAAVERVAPDRWTVNSDNVIEVDNEPVRKALDVILIPGPHEGILNMAPGAIRRALNNAEAASDAARNPNAYLELHDTGAVPLTPDERADLLTGWTDARRGRNGGVAFTSAGIEVKEHGTHEAALLIEGRNADAVDMSRLISSPATMADATTSGASLTYETSTGRNAQFKDYGLAIYMAAIEARLSQDDIVAPGSRMAFDASSITQLTEGPPAGPNRED